MRKIFIPIAAMAVVLLLSTGALADSHGDSETFTADLQQANDSGGSATADLSLDGNDLTVRVDGQGFFDEFPHAMHLHGDPGGDNVCGPLNPGDDGFDEADEDGDGFLNTSEGAPSYGPITVSLTTEGDTSPDSGLAVDRFSTSETIDYERTFEVSDEVAENLSSLHIVIHGGDLEDSGEIGDLEDEDGNVKESDLDPELPFEATVPVACGQVVTAGVGNGPDTGAGGAASTTSGVPGALVAGLLGAGALGALALRRRNATTT